MTPVLQAADLVIGYRPSHGAAGLLPPLQLAVQAGELVCLLGPNGAGKSTLLATLAGLQPPLGGDVAILGTAMTRMSPKQRARKVAVVLTERECAGRLTVQEIVALGRHPHRTWSGRQTAEDRRAIADALASVDAVTLADREFQALSDGERQRVMVARAVAQEPALLLLDEPTAFLDVTARRQIMDLLRLIASVRRLAVVASTHELELALACADTVWLAAAGGLAIGPPSRLRASGDLARAFPPRPMTGAAL